MLCREVRAFARRRVRALVERDAAATHAEPHDAILGKPSGSRGRRRWGRVGGHGGRR